MSSNSVQRREVTVRLPNGLHLRPISRVAKIAAEYDATLNVHCDGQTVDAKSPLELMSLILKASYGKTLTLEAFGDDAEALLDAVAPIFEQESGEFLAQD